jgi:hypothetical protein
MSPRNRPQLPHPSEAEVEVVQAWIAAGAKPVACLGNPDSVGMKVYAPAGEETFDDIQTTEEAHA